MPGRHLTPLLLAILTAVPGVTLGWCGLASASLPVGWDIRMGPSVTGASGKLADSLDRARGGFDGGVAIRWPRSSSSPCIQAEFLVTSRSRTFDDVIGFRRSLRVVYGQLPLFARAPLRRNGKLRPYVLAGPYYAWRLSSRIEPGSYAGDEPVNPGDVRATGAGAIIGLGSDVLVNRGRATFELRVGLGFVDVLENRARTEGTFRVFTFLIGFAASE